MNFYRALNFKNFVPTSNQICNHIVYVLLDKIRLCNCKNFNSYTVNPVRIYYWIWNKWKIFLYLSKFLRAWSRMNVGNSCIMRNECCVKDLIHHMRGRHKDVFVCIFCVYPSLNMLMIYDVYVASTAQT